MIKYYLLTEAGYKNLCRIFNENEQDNSLGERFGIDVVELNPYILNDIIAKIKLENSYQSNENPFRSLV